MVNNISLKIVHATVLLHQIECNARSGFRKWISDALRVWQPRLAASFSGSFNSEVRFVCLPIILFMPQNSLELLYHNCFSAYFERLIPCLSAKTFNIRRWFILVSENICCMGTGTRLLMMLEPTGTKYNLQNRYPWLWNIKSTQQSVWISQVMLYGKCDVCKSNKS